jgi:glycosyltransferase involved in cell wall biosynthesis
MKQGCRVLLSLMQLNIGGAETHVVELAKELSRRGYTVIVTSKGGVYTSELAEAGIKHYAVPLQNKNPINMLKAYGTLKKIIINEKINLVHSHARIPSFILGKLHRRMKFPFVTTAHWVFSTKYGLKYLTDWGQKTIAVSEDIKTYLMDNYHVPEADITVTINGIDTDKFSPLLDTDQIQASLGLQPEDNCITYVSRMDEDRSLVAKQLLSIVPELDSKIDHLKVILVGGGNDFDAVSSLAKNINDTLGRDAVILTGARTDINQLVGVCKLFVGVSRAALEAMAAEKATIIAGNEGYIGLFGKDKLDVAVDTNFCCRGCPASTPESLKEDILTFFSLSEEKQKNLGEYGRNLIKTNYSVAKMTDDTIRVYNSVLKQ